VVLVAPPVCPVLAGRYDAELCRPACVGVRLNRAEEMYGTMQVWFLGYAKAAEFGGCDW
jgi:hypothetical protein